MSAPRGDLPLVETHLHLEGSIPRRVLARLALRSGRRLAGGAPRPGLGLQRRRGFVPFLDSFVFCASLLKSREDIERAAFALIEDLRAEGVAHAEIFFSPQVYLRRGVALVEVLGALEGATRRARIAGGPSIAWIADGGRLWGPAWFEEIVDQIAGLKPRDVVAVGLGGDEAASPARAFRRAFDAARRAGLHTVAHAGEGTTARSVWEALDDLGVERIGHGISAAADRSLLRRLARDGVTLEVCPTSNLMTRAVPSLRRHPLRALIDAGVRVSLGSDDRSIFGTTLRREIALAVGALGVGEDEIPRLMVHAAEASFTSGDARRRLAARIRAAARRGTRREAPS
ncbi:MAG: adenosine deaminase [Acidobacteria bacterium]|nr:adenosine deaminase [Acidobacteriota bacterium]